MSEENWRAAGANPDSPHSAAYARRVKELEETIRVQGERLKLLDFAARPDVWIARSNVDTYRVFVEGDGGVYWAGTLEEALRKAMDHGHAYSAQ